MRRIDDENESAGADQRTGRHHDVSAVAVDRASDDRRDEAAAATLSKLYPGREIVLVDARLIFAGGGGIHCITQQQPAPREEAA